jgi:signal transduction histidine kinase
MNTRTIFRAVTAMRTYQSSGRRMNSLILPEEVLHQPARFVTALAHEVRNPLTNINLAVDMLAYAIKDDEPKLYLDIIRRSSARINYLICDLLKYQESDKAEGSQYSMHRLIDEVLEIAVDRIRLKNITVRREYALEDKQILADKNRIRMALTNIVINAIDAMSSENGELRLTESLVEGHYSLQIADNGCGIPAEHLQQIFDPYFTRKPGGLGLGLSTTREILQENHIGMNVESTEGEGTCFTLSFDQKDVSLLA